MIPAPPKPPPPRVISSWKIYSREESQRYYDNYNTKPEVKNMNEKIEIITKFINDKWNLLSNKSKIVVGVIALIGFIAIL